MRRKPEWSGFAVGGPSTRPNWTNTDCEPFDTVFHICHVTDAFRVFEDGRIRSSLVWDESKLKHTRSCVSWVSSNYWVLGSIYGSIRFDFDWKELVEGKRLYWVEAIARYNPPAYRILISDQEYDGIRLERYDPRLGDGPLFYDSETETWYRNGNLTGEFLIDGHLWLGECKKVGFVHHHPDTCRNERSRCPYLGKSGVEAGAELIARLVGHNILDPKELFLDTSASRKQLRDEVNEVWAHLKRSLRVAAGPKGRITHKHPAALSLVTAILDRFGLSRPKGTAKLCDLFSSTEELRLAMAQQMVRAFGLPSVRSLERTDLDVLSQGD